MPIAKMTRLLKAVSTQGPGWALVRARLALSKKLGVQEAKTPLASWEDFPLAKLVREDVPSDPAAYLEWRSRQDRLFFFDRISSSDAAAHVSPNSVAGADQILQGTFPFFSYWRQLGMPPKWSTNPLTDSETPLVHWSRIDEFTGGDIKFCWEVNRFGWAFMLARAYARSKDDKYAVGFWRLFEDWLAANPPNSGVNWVCGQETSLRGMALCFALHAFAYANASTVERKTALIRALAVHALRVDSFFDYAVSQNNNHAISEAVFLFTVGLLFPELGHAPAWKSRGKQTLERAAARQIYSDGAYIQHSANYHRMMLQELCWALQLGERNGESFSPEFRLGLVKALTFLSMLTDRSNGRAPNYGPNDGALVLPLSDCDYTDFRPVLQATAAVAQAVRLFEPGPWDEEAAWLNDFRLPPEKLSVAPARGVLDAHDGGCFTLHAPNSWLMVRSAQFKDRPSHSDQLHVDLWWRGTNLLCDSGTYSYNGEPPFLDGYASARYHNSITVDGFDPMTRISRFMWSEWAQAKAYRGAAGSNVIEAEHDGYVKRMGIRHRRAIKALDNDVWIIVDDLIGRGTHVAELHWLVADAPVALENGELTIELEPGVARMCLFGGADSTLDIVRAGKRTLGSGSASIDAARGWVSRYYGKLDPAMSVRLSTVANFPLRLITVLLLANDARVKVSDRSASIAIGSATVQLCEPGAERTFA